MNLRNFEGLIEKKIIDRGFRYYESDRVEDLEQVGELEFSATIWGTERYSIFVKLNSKLDIIEHECDCPYDWGDFCKHKVAVLYYIKDAELYIYAPTSNNTNLKRITASLQKISKQEIVVLILERAKRNKKFREEILEKLGHEIDR